jgi:gliding motility-associated protein GldM
VPHNPALAKSLPVKITELKRTQDNPSGDWAFGTFHNIPVMATVAMFSKYQNDVKNAEAMVLEDLSSRVYLDDLKFDSLIAIATPNTTYALNGQEIEAQIVLGAFNKNTNPIMTSNAGAVTVKNGVGTLKIKASGTGKRPVSGTVTAEMNGEKMTFPYKFEYTVGTAGASLQLDKMQVMYIGVDNPITIAASGYNIEDVKPNMPWATLTPNGPGKYFAKVTTAGKYQFSIDASSRGGATGGKIQSGEIRVLPIPDPIASIGGKQGGLIPTNSAKAQSGVSAKLTEFVFETQFKVTSFRFTYLPKIGDPVSVEVKGNAFDAAAQQLIKRSNPSDRWLIENVRAIGPDNKVRTINTIILTLN